eukprot:TRINITY_DN10561_c1_g1_i1.p1 TRINITY_DN10561_c1_g1~~TRINITY_DN10561_c1_g1_i1.p1  ORF type:complete len:222 (-),score=55.98 TRINITY_DN10561_c1_g1_i1:141-806(-)
MEVLSLLIGASTSNEHKQFNEVQRVYDMINIKAYVLGDDATGKTSLLIKRATNEFPDEPVPTVFDNYCENVSLPEGNMVCLGFWDSTAAEDYPKYRPLGYPGTDVFVLCYSITSPQSFLNIRDCWMPEITQHVPGTPVILVGNKIDLRSDVATEERLAKQGLMMITHEEGVQMRMEVGAESFFECSALTGEGLKEIFAEVLRISLRSRTGSTKPSSRCCLL